MNGEACGGGEGGGNPASDQCSPCRDFASLDPLNIKQNNKQVRRGRAGAWREEGSPARPKLRSGILSVCRRVICGLQAPSTGFWRFCHLPFWSLNCSFF